MAISKDYAVTWADMRNLFDRVNSERNRFRMSVVDTNALLKKES